jgi:hypothetical protein
MATDDHFIQAGHGAGSRSGARRLVSFTVNGNTTLKDAGVVLPAGSWFRGLTLDTPAAISGSPSSVNFRAGTADDGQQIVADVDAKGQGHINATIVAGLDKVGGFLNADTILYLQLTTAGGSSSVGTVHAIIDYDAPPR